MYTDKSFTCGGCVLNPAVDGDPPKNVGSAHSLTMGYLKHKPSANGRLPSDYSFLYAKWLQK
jgi:hypothetical protein